MQEHEGKQGAPRTVDFSALADYGQLAEKGGSSADCEEKKDGNYRKAVDCIYRFIDNQDMGDLPAVAVGRVRADGRGAGPGQRDAVR